MSFDRSDEITDLEVQAFVRKLKVDHLRYVCVMELAAWIMLVMWLVSRLMIDYNKFYGIINSVIKCKWKQNYLEVQKKIVIVRIACIRLQTVYWVYLYLYKGLTYTYDARRGSSNDRILTNLMF